MKEVGSRELPNTSPVASTAGPMPAESIAAITATIRELI